MKRRWRCNPIFPKRSTIWGCSPAAPATSTSAERHFRDALARRSDYGEAANNLALILASRGQADAAVTLLERLLQRRPEYRGRVRDAGQDPFQR